MAKWFVSSCRRACGRVCLECGCTRRHVAAYAPRVAAHGCAWQHVPTRGPHKTGSPLVNRFGPFLDRFPKFTKIHPEIDFRVTNPNMTFPKSSGINSDLLFQKRDLVRLFGKKSTFSDLVQKVSWVNLTPLGLLLGQIEVSSDLRGQT